MKTFKNVIVESQYYNLYLISIELLLLGVSVVRGGISSTNNNNTGNKKNKKDRSCIGRNRT